MAKGKSEYIFNVGTHQVEAISAITNFAASYGYAMVAPAEYEKGDGFITSKRGFNYVVNGEFVSIYAYIGTSKKPHQLEKTYGWAVSHSMLEEFKGLFDVLNRLQYAPAVQTDNSNSTNNPTANYEQYMNQNLTNTAAIQEEAAKRNDKYATISFIISLISVVMAFTGTAFGVLIQIINYWMAAQGLKSSKKGLALAAIIINTFAIILAIIITVVSIL